jgi:hypothetical protein
MINVVKYMKTMNKKTDKASPGPVPSIWRSLRRPRRTWCRCRLSWPLSLEPIYHITLFYAFGRRKREKKGGNLTCFAIGPVILQSELSLLLRGKALYSGKTVWLFWKAFRHRQRLYLFIFREKWNEAKHFHYQKW